MTDEIRRLGPVSPIDLVGEVDFPLGASRVSPSRLEVSRAGLHETLEPRIMQVLVALYQADGRVVSRDELITRCWEGRVVGEDAITRAIGRLRRLSEADGGASFVVETIPKIGFRLAAAAQTTAAGAGPPMLSRVEALPAESLEKTAPELDIAPVVGLPRWRGWRLATGLSLFAVAAFALTAWLLWPPRPAGVSVAVLPFVNMSGEASQEFFSDGMTEEITSALAKVPGLTVIGRTSAFQFKGENKDLRAIGRALGVSDLIEGSVRKDGNQVRITAQLIKAADGTHLWTESYDRKLTDIFAVQEDIATAIAGAMQVPLGLKRGQSLVSNRTADTDSYQDYLRARALFRARKPDEVLAILKSVVARDPNYAPAWALLSVTYSLPSQFNAVESAARAGSLEDARRLAQSTLDRAEKAAREAIRLDPRLAMGYAALGNIQLARGNWAASEDYTRQALMLDPNDPDTLYGYAAFLASAGRLKDARRVQIQILAQEPFVPNYNRQAASVLWAMGQNDAAIRILETLDTQETRDIERAKVYATARRYTDAADTLLAIPQLSFNDRRSLEDAAKLLRSAPAKISAPDALPRLPWALSFVYLFIGAEDRSLEVAEREMAAGYYAVLFRDPWGPPSASLRKTERFKAFVRKAKLVDYWRARGWPDLCHPVGPDDFACN
jgi:TolB-like protein/DNA-binding winged helix-turn-helix (wHTH) protein